MKKLFLFRLKSFIFLILFSSIVSALKINASRSNSPLAELYAQKFNDASTEELNQQWKEIIQSLTPLKLRPTELKLGNGVYCFYLNGDGTRFATTYPFSNVSCICDARSGAVIHALNHKSQRPVNRISMLNGKTYGDCTEAVSWSNAGNLIATAYHDNTACIWDADTGKNIHILDHIIGRVVSLLWNNDGKFLATITYDGIFMVWDAQTGKKVYSSSKARSFDERLGECYYEKNRVKSAMWDRSGTQIIVTFGCGAMRTLNLETGTMTLMPQNAFAKHGELVWNNKKNKFAERVHNDIGDSFSIRDAQSGAEQFKLDTTSWISWNADDAFLLGQYSNKKSTSCRLCDLPGYYNNTYSPRRYSNTFLFSCRLSDVNTFIRDGQTGEELHVLLSAPPRMRWNINGSCVLSGERDYKTGLWSYFSWATEHLYDASYREQYNNLLSGNLTSDQLMLVRLLDAFRKQQSENNPVSFNDFAQQHNISTKVLRDQLLTFHPVIRDAMHLHYNI